MIGEDLIDTEQALCTTSILKDTECGRSHPHGRDFENSRDEVSNIVWRLLISEQCMCRIGVRRKYSSLSNGCHHRQRLGDEGEYRNHRARSRICHDSAHRVLGSDIGRDSQGAQREGAHTQRTSDYSGDVLKECGLLVDSLRCVAQQGGSGQINILEMRHRVLDSARAASWSQQSRSALVKKDLQNILKLPCSDTVGHGKSVVHIYHERFDAVIL